MFARFSFQFFDALIGSWQFFGHGTAETFDRFAYGFTDLIVRGIRFLRGIRAFASHFCFGLRNAEEIGGNP